MKMDRPNSGPSRSSILGLDALNFLMADVRDGVGPYLFFCFVYARNEARR
jgi:hypothetical protein